MNGLVFFKKYSSNIIDAVFLSLNSDSDNELKDYGVDLIVLLLNFDIDKLTVEKSCLNLISFLSILILGGATLLLKDDIFIKWKPTAVYWFLATALLFSQIFSKKPLMQHLAESTIQMPDKIWRQINLSWCIFFAAMGIANLYVVYNFDTNVWVNFKLFGTLGLTIVFITCQSIYMAKHSHLQNGTLNDTQA